MTNRYFDASAGSCQDYWFNISGSSSSSTRYLRFRDMADAAVAGSSIPIARAMIYDDWVDAPTATYISRYRPYTVPACVAPDLTAALPFRVKLEGPYSPEIVDFAAAPPDPDVAVAAQAIVMPDKAYAAAGDTVTYTVYLRDALNRFKTAGGDTVTAVKPGYADADLSVSAVTDNGDGSYTFTVTKPTDGWVYVDIAVNGDAVTSPKSSVAFGTPGYMSTSGPDSTLTVAGDRAIVTVRSYGGADPASTSDRSGWIRVFADKGVSFGAPARTGDFTYEFPMTVAEGGGGSVHVYGFLDYAKPIGALIGVQQIDALGPAVATASRQLGLRATVEGPASSRDLDLRALVNDLDDPNSFPSAGSPNQAYPRYSSWTIR